MRKYIYFILSIALTVLILNGCEGIENNTKESSLELTELNYNDIKDKLIRFHVIANSDTDEDQNLKLKVRDKVVEALSEKLSNVNSLEEAENVLKENIDFLRSIVYKDNLFTNEENCKIDVTEFKESYLLGAAMVPLEEFLN